MDNLLEKIIKNKKAEEVGKLNAIKIVNSLFDELLTRERDVLTRRFGLHGGDSETLEKIGSLHKLTRERVRQIEATSIRKLKKLDNLESYLEVVKKAVEQLLAEHGGLMHQDFLLDILAMFCIDEKATPEERELYKRHFDFIISKLLEDDIEKVSKSDNFDAFYKTKDQSVAHLEELVSELATKINQGQKTLDIEALLDLFKNSGAFNKHKTKLTPESNVDMTGIYKNQIFPEKGEIINANKILYSLIDASKQIDRNKFGHWGLNEWPEITPKKISDKIYLVLKENGQPLHFTEIADKINEVGFDHKKANAGTVHNELILDNRYILMDRGKYGLKEWQK